MSRSAASAGTDQAQPIVVSSRAQQLRLWCGATAVVVIVAMTVVALLLPTSSDGTSFHSGDQIAVFGVGLLLGGAFWLPTRPRLRADRDAIHVRTIVGGYKTVPWTVVRSVEFRPRWQWARLVLPADETISLYALQRIDGARSITVMRQLRELHAAAHDRGSDPGMSLGIDPGIEPGNS